MTNYEKQLVIGAVYRHKSLQYLDGEKDNKRLVLLNEPRDTDGFYIFAKTTSQQKYRKLKQGCQPQNECFYIPKEEEIFPLNTWIQISELYPFVAKSLIKDSQSGELEHLGILSELSARQIINCLKAIRGKIEPIFLDSIIDSFNRRFGK